MIIPSLMTLGIASVAACLSINTKEEIIKVATAFVAIIAGFLTLCFAPWIIKLVIVAVPFLFDLIGSSSIDI